MASVSEATFVRPLSRASQVRGGLRAAGGRDASGLLPVQRRRPAPLLSRAQRDLSPVHGAASNRTRAHGARARLQQRQRDPRDARRRRRFVLPRRPPDADGSGGGRTAVRAAQPGSALRDPLRRLAAADAGTRRHLPPPRHAAGRRLRALAPQRDGRGAAWLVRRLVGLLPLQDAAAAERRAARAEHATVSSRSSGFSYATPGSASVLGRTAELLVQRIRGRANRVGAALQVVKRGVGRAAGALDVAGPTSATSASTSTEWIWRCRACRRGCSSGSTSTTSAAGASRTTGCSNRSSWPRCSAGLQRVARRRVPAVLPDARARQGCRGARCSARRGRPRVLEREHGVGRRDGTRRAVPAPHVLELPIHQDLTPRHIAHVARKSPRCRQAGRAMTPVTQAVRALHATGPPAASGWKRSTPPGD